MCCLFHFDLYRYFLGIFTLLISLSLLSACETLVNHESVAPEIDKLLLAEPMPVDDTKLGAKSKIKSVATTNDLGLLNEPLQKQPEFFPGSGVFVGHSHSVDANTTASSVKLKDDVSLNFQDTDIHDLAKVVLGDVLKKNYVIDPEVRGVVNIQTSRPFHRADLMHVMNDLLQMSGATMIQSGGLIKIVPASKATLSSLPPKIGRRISNNSGGVYTQVVPLRYVGVEEIHKILQPFLKEAVAQTYPERNIIILTGTQSDLNRLTETIHLFDIDWLKGMSLAMIPLKHADATEIVRELDTLFGKASGSPMANIVRFMPLQRLNGVIVVTQQPRYLKEMSLWIERLDRSEGIGGQQLYVYPVQNKRAGELAQVLNNIFSSQQTSTSTFLAPSLAPGLEPVVLTSGEENNNAVPQAGTLEQQVSQAASPTVVAGEGIVLPGADAVKIIADETNNSLLILATPSDHQMVENALRKLDVTPLQVLIEASIIEVTLTDDLSYGLEWFFKTNTGIGGKNGLATLDLGDGGLDALVPGFSYGIVDSGGDVRAIFNSLASESKVNVLSSPSLMVLDNHTATINIGDQVPVLTSESTSNVTDDARTVNQIEYRDTGVLMTVTPRVNASGLIIMDIVQEVTDVVRTESSGIDAPTFQQRSIESTISVNSGNSIVLGGLIRDNRSSSKSGFPWLHKTPFIGPLFGRTSNILRRTELVVLLTPRAILSKEDAWQITNEYKGRLQDLYETIDEIKE